MKIQNFEVGNKQFEKYFQQELEKYFIDIKILLRFTKPSVRSQQGVFNSIAFYLHRVHIDGSNKYGWIEEPNKFLTLNFIIFVLLKRFFCVRFFNKFQFYK